MPVLGVGRFAKTPAQTHGNAFFAHNSRDTLAPNARSVVSKLSMDSWTSVGFVALFVNYSYLGCEHRVLLSSL
jgi:hypothetical protein